MPLIGTAFLENFALMIKDDALDLRLDFEAFRNAGETINNGLKRFLADRSRFRLARVLRLKYRCGFSEPGFLAGLAFLDGVDFISRHVESQTEQGFQRDGGLCAKREIVGVSELVELRHGVW